MTIGNLTFEYYKDMKLVYAILMYNDVHYQQWILSSVVGAYHITASFVVIRQLLL